MQEQLRGKLESAALRLDGYLDAAEALGPRETLLLAAAREIAEAMAILQAG